MFNWVDFIILCIMVRYVYIARKSEFVPELFKLFGVLFATVFSIHYYQSFNRVIQSYFLIPEGLGNVFAFLIIVVLIVLIFVFIREGWMIILKMKMHLLIDKFLGVALLLLRCYLVCGIVFFALMLVRYKRVEVSVKSALTHGFFSETSGIVYNVCYASVIKRFFPDEKVNRSIIRKSASDIRRERRLKRVKRSERIRQKD